VAPVPAGDPSSGPAGCSAPSGFGRLVEFGGDRPGLGPAGQGCLADGRRLFLQSSAFGFTAAPVFYGGMDVRFFYASKAAVF